ncbi:MAG: nucleotide exchange factor GrpE [Leptolyngbya sp. SIO1D8]|nr:nucleotide exchange factor GrpE [Leptolyngbya sp. SIO1D8]
MVDETRPTDSSQEVPEVAGDNLADGQEVLRNEEDAAVDADVEASVPDEATQGGGDGNEVDNADTAITSEQGADTSELEAQIVSIKAQMEDRTSQYMRIAADFENYRRRTSKEREEQALQIKCNTISELLPVIDNFERARSQIKPQSEQEMTIHKSYQSVYKQLVDCLKRLGVSAMRAEGQEFDPNLHEAVMREPTDQYPEGTVMEELVRGYMISDQANNRVLRHAMVKVSAPPEPTSESTPDSGEGE